MRGEMKARPIIKTINSSVELSKEESFQNTIVRQIIKMKHELIIHHFKNYLVSKKVVFNSLKEEKKLELINTSMKKDISLRSEMRGFIIGDFTADEYLAYSEMKSDINRRISNIIIERLGTNLKTLSE